MIVLALVLLIIVLVFSVAIVVSNPDVYSLSLFRVLVPVTSAGVFFTGFGAALVTIIALLLLRTGIRRTRETRRRLRTAELPKGSGAETRSGQAATPGARPVRAPRTPTMPAPAGRTTGPWTARPTRRTGRTGSTLDLEPGEDRDDRSGGPADRRARHRPTGTSPGPS